MEEKTIKVLGMTCKNCEQKIKKSILKLKDIVDVNISLETKMITIKYINNKFNEQKIKKEINDLGYKYKGVINNNNNKPVNSKDIIIIFISIIIVYLIIDKIVGYKFITNIPNISNNISLPMIFIIGLLTSIHCVGMCGSINLAVSTSNNKTLKNTLLYNLGRIISYTVIGALVGALGSVLSLNYYIQAIIILIAAILMLLMGLSTLGLIPNYLYKFMPQIPKIKNSKNKTLLIGLLNGLMPCGPLQAMQLYALSTGSIILGALSMFLFALGTIPLVLGVGILFTKLNNKYNYIIQIISSILIVLLSLLMMNRAISLLDLKITNPIKNIIKENYQNYAIAKIIDNKQYVTIELKDGYTPVIVQKDIPLVFNIKVDDIRYYGCTNTVKIPSLNISKKLKNGDNIIELTPTKIGNIRYTCWMGMVNSNIKVVDKIKNY
jgi:uncharacterized protein